MQEYKDKCIYKHWTPQQLEFLCFQTMYHFIYTFKRVSDSCLLKALGSVQFISSAETQLQCL